MASYQINKDLREMCVFTRHNLLTDPPFSKLDLVSCRNVLIYLASVQKNIIPLFHYALKPNGFLMLGASETAAFPELFSLVDREHRIYSRRETARKPYPFRTGVGRGLRRRRREQSRGAAGGSAGTAPDVRQEVDRLLLSRYSPAGVVVDEELEVLEIRGKANTFSLAAGGQSELQSPQADPGDQSVPGSGKVGPPGAAHRRVRAAGAHPVRSRRAAPAR